MFSYIIITDFFRAEKFKKRLQKEKSLDTAYRVLKREHKSLEMAYKLSEIRNLRFKDSIVPALNTVVKEKNIQFTNLDEKNQLQKENYHSQLKSKNGNFWKGVGGGTLLGLLLMVVFGG